MMHGLANFKLTEMLYLWGKKCTEFGISSSRTARNHFLRLISRISAHRYNIADGVRSRLRRVVGGAQTHSLEIDKTYKNLRKENGEMRKTRRK